MPIDNWQVNNYYHHIRLTFRCPMNVMNEPSRPSPPKPTARKDDPINKAFEIRAKKLLRDTMDARGVNVEELAKRLADIGVDMSAGGVANKISRGGFSSAFMMQCMEALSVRVTVTDK